MRRKRSSKRTTELATRFKREKLEPPHVGSYKSRVRLGWAGGAGHVLPALGHRFEEFVAFAQASHADILVFEHRLDDAQDRLRTKIIAAIELLDRFENFFFRKPGVFERRLLQPVIMDDV